MLLGVCTGWFLSFEKFWYVGQRLLIRTLLHAEPITSVRQTRDGNAVLVSTLDSTIRLMDKGNGQLLQSYKGHTNTEYRIRSTLGMADSMVISGSEDGKLYAWDLLEGKVVETMEAHEGKVASAVACNGTKKEWVSAGVDGKLLYRCRAMEAVLTLARYCLCVGHARIDPDEKQQEVLGKQNTSMMPPYAQIIQSVIVWRRRK